MPLGVPVDPEVKVMRAVPSGRPGAVGIAPPLGASGRLAPQVAMA
jgi:hypothetical protein